MLYMNHDLIAMVYHENKLSSKYGW